MSHKRQPRKQHPTTTTISQPELLLQQDDDEPPPPGERAVQHQWKKNHDDAKERRRPRSRSASPLRRQRRAVVLAPSPPPPLLADEEEEEEEEAEQVPSSPLLCEEDGDPEARFNRTLLIFLERHEAAEAADPAFCHCFPREQIALHKGLPPKTRRLVELVLHWAEDVWRALGPGLAEKAYHAALRHALSVRAGLAVNDRPPLEVQYDGVVVARSEPDLVVREGDTRLVVELKAVASATLPTASAQLAAYMRLQREDWGVLINFARRAPQYAPVPMQAMLMQRARVPQTRGAELP